MKQEQTIVHINIANGSTSLAVGTHIRQFVVLAKGLTIRGSTNTTSDIEFLGYDIIPDGIDSMDIVLIACERSHIGHTGIHIGSTNSMTYSLILFDDWLMSLGILMYDGGLATIIEEELSLIEIFLITCYQIEFSKGHLCNLMTRYYTSLTRIRANFLADHIRITDGNIEELTASSSLIMGDGTFNHMAKVIELMTQVFFLTPTLIASPLMWFLWILGARGIEVPVRLLSRGNNIENRVDICHEFLIRIGLQNIAGTLNGLVGIGIIESQSADLEYL